MHIAASLAAGTVATTVCAPADVLKSRLQSAPSINGKAPVGKLNETFDSADDVQGLVRIFVTSLKNEGPGFLMKGWTPAWLRLA